MSIPEKIKKHFYNNCIGDFDKRYSDKLKEFTKKHYQKKRLFIAQHKIEKLSALFYKLLVMENRKFDVILSPGNSGLYMGKILEIIYEEFGLGIDFPEYYCIPVFRDGTENNYEIESPKNNICEVLIIDDEIMTGTSAKECLVSLLKNTRNSHYNVTIVAENMFFEWHYRLPGVSVYFYPYSRIIHGLTNNISFILPKKPYEEISAVFPIYKERKQILALLLTGKIKEKTHTGKWCFDETVEQKIKARVPNYSLYKSNLISTIRNCINSGRSKIKDGKIEFPVK